MINTLITQCVGWKIPSGPHTSASKIFMLASDILMLSLLGHLLSTLLSPKFDAYGVSLWFKCFSFHTSHKIFIGKYTPFILFQNLYLIKIIWPQMGQLNMTEHKNINFSK